MLPTKQALEIWKRICAALRAYRGHNKGFGRKITAFISSTRPKPKKWRGKKAYWADKNKQGLTGEVSTPKATGLLSSAEDPTENLESTERLLRLLIAAPPKSSQKKPAKRNRSKRGTVPRTLLRSFPLSG